MDMILFYCVEAKEHFDDGCHIVLKKSESGTLQPNTIFVIDAPAVLLENFLVVCGEIFFCLKQMLFLGAKIAHSLWRPMYWHVLHVEKK